MSSFYPRQTPELRAETFTAPNGRVFTLGAYVTDLEGDGKLYRADRGYYAEIDGQYFVEWNGEGYTVVLESGIIRFSTSLFQIGMEIDWHERGM